MKGYPTLSKSSEARSTCQIYFSVILKTPLYVRRQIFWEYKQPILSLTGMTVFIENLQETIHPVGSLIIVHISMQDLFTEK